MLKLLALFGALWVATRPRAVVTQLQEIGMSNEDYEEVQKRGYWCLACGRYIEATQTADGRFVILHDKDVDHSFMTYDEEDHPQ